MLKKILFVLLLTFLNINLVFGFHFKEIDTPDYPSYIKQDFLENIPQLMTAISYTEEDLNMLRGAFRCGEEEMALNIYSRIKKFSKDEKLLKKVNLYQNIAFIKMLVKNEALISIEQLPIVSMNIYSELPVKEMSQVVYKGDKKLIFSLGMSLDEMEADKIKTEIVEYEPKEYYKSYVKFFEVITTYALMEKYPAMAGKYAQDYIAKNGMNTNLLEILIDNGDYNVAISLGNQYQNEPFVKELFAVTYAKSGKLDEALELSNEIINSAKSDETKINAMINKMYIYKYAGILDESKEKILEIENEIIIIAKEGNYKQALDFEVGDLFYFMTHSSINFRSSLYEFLILTQYYTDVIPFDIGNLENKNSTFSSSDILVDQKKLK